MVELADSLRGLPWGEAGVPAPLDRLLVTGSRRRVDGGAGRVAFQLLAALGISGWSARLDLQAAVNTIRRTSLSSGVYGRAWQTLKQAGLYETQTAFFGGRPAVIARLTDLGRTLLAQVGTAVVVSEWERIEANHRRAGEGEQLPHTTAICLFLHHARIRGYTTEVCPNLKEVAMQNDARGQAGVAEPDALIVRGGQRTYVEVQRRGGAKWRRVRKWRRQFELQGYAAICAATPQLAQELAAEAQVAQVARGYITDLITLARGAPADLWTHRWRSQHSRLEAAADTAVDRDEPPCDPADPGAAARS
jgi:DNA-binding PadR family transcriptional regulator